jgi:hypothetical protein
MKRATFTRIDQNEVCTSRKSAFQDGCRLSYEILATSSRRLMVLAIELDVGSSLTSSHVPTSPETFG